jgi:alpha-L-rhamnosidase
LALEFDILQLPAQRLAAAARLADLVREAGHRISTGFLATPLVCDALANNGFLDDAYLLLLQEECPSWLYQVKQGATTIWERWDSLLPDGSVNPGDMTSFNHFAFGAVIDWLHRSIAGLGAASPGYKQIAVRPHVGGGLTHARARHLTPYGMAEVSWRLDGGRLDIEAIIPEGTSATVHLPGASRPENVDAGSHSWSVSWPADDAVTADAITA